MSIYTKAFASYLARTFYPVTVTFKSAPMMYSNPLFSVSHRIDAHQRSDNKYQTEYIQFDYAINKYNSNKFCNNTKLNTPESFIKHMLDKPKTITTYQLKEINSDEKLMQFNTNGNIPFRYIDIFNDFSLHKLNYIKPTEADFQKYELEILEKIVNFQDKELFDIYTYAEYLSIKENIYKIEVKNAPSYKNDPNFINKYYKNSYRKPILDLSALEFIKKKYWHSGDGDLSSPSTKIFFERSSYFSSLNKLGYKILFSTTGGIDMSYAYNLPWFVLKTNMRECHKYFEVCGYNIYLSSHIGITEFIILSEALAKEGAEYVLEKTLE